jgi:predicted extracellular nuclease
MSKSLFKMFSAITILALMMMALPMQSVGAVSSNIVISQIYGGGGNSGATYTNDFVELFNRGTAPVDITGWSVQYASAAGTTWAVTALTSVTLQPGQYYLVQEAAGTGGTTPLPTPDATGSIPMSATAGKVALVNNTTPLTGTGCPLISSVVDFVGFGGTANCFEGPGPAPAPSNTTADLRSAAGCTETDVNSTDFATGAPLPRNTGSALNPCPIGDTAPSVSSTTPSNGATNVAVNADITVTFSEAVNVTGSWFSISCGTSGAHTAAVSGGSTTFTLNPDADFTNNESCTVNIVAAQVADQDANDPPNNMVADYIFSFNTVSGNTAAALVINEIDYDQPSTDTAEFLEIKNNDSISVDLSAYNVQMVNGDAGGAVQYRLFALPSVNLAPGDYFVLCANNTTVASCDLDVLPDTDLIQNGSPDAVALRFGTTIVDTVSYEGNTGAPYTEGSGTGLEDPGTTGNVNLGISRFPDGTDTNQNNVDFSTRCITPGEANSSSTSGCQVDTAPTVTSTNPANGATDVPVNSNIGINFSEPVTVNGSWFSITCANSGAHTAAVSGGPQNFTLDPDVDFGFNESCTVTVLAANVADQDGTPNNMAADYTFSFTTSAQAFVCGDPATLISTVQGSGASSPVAGTEVVIEGIVVGDFQNNASLDNGNLNGFNVQEEDAQADSDPLTSEGIFVFGASADVSVGDAVRVRGTVTEFNGLTEINNVTALQPCSTGNTLPTAASVSLPVENTSDFERYEGMRVSFPQELVIAEYFNYERFGELVLALPLPDETRPFTGTAIDEPGAPAQARALANSLRRITLDDGLSSQNPDEVRHPNGDAFALDNRFRGGDIVQNTTGVMDFSFSLYRIQPTAAADYTASNPRPAEPEDVGGRLRVAAMNTLNFFLTLDATASDEVGDCGASQTLDCRGADANEPQEFERQRDKLLAALAGLDADIIGLNELENTPNVDPLGDPTNGIVAGLNDLLGAGMYDSIDTGVIGTDAIRVGMIYKPAEVTPVGPFQILDSTDDSRFIDTRNRPSLAQTFEEVATGARFTVVVNHFKSKGSACTGDPDTGDGQGNCNQTRLAAAQALVDWLATDPTGSGDPDFLIMGDLNSYAQEDPIDAIKLGPDDTAATSDDYVNLIAQHQGTYAYSYTFDGQAGYLDHALANLKLASQVTGAADWHINSDEPDLLDYDTSFKPPAQEAIYQPNAYRSSDHDPVIVGLDLTVPDTTPPSVTINQDSGQPDPTNISPINFTVVFSEPVNGFDGNDVVLGGTAGATTAIVTEVAPNNGTTYNVAVSGMTANGTVTASIPASAATDAAGNGNTASTSTDNTVTYNNTAPTVAVAAGGMCAASGGTMNLVVSDAEGDTLTLSGSSSDTSVVPNANIVFGGSGSNRMVTITAVPAGTVRTAAVTITADDGFSTSSTTITVVVGTSGNNTALNGTSGADLILGLSGNDTLNGLAGIDLLCTGTGNDTANGGDDDDTLDGDSGNDTLNGGNGNDSLSGGSGNDKLNGEAGNDSMAGGSGNDKLTGGTEADSFSGGTGNDTNVDFNAGEGDTSDET